MPDDKKTEQELKKVAGGAARPNPYEQAPDQQAKEPIDPSQTPDGNDFDTDQNATG